MLASAMDNSVIMCDELIQSYYEEAKTVPANLNEKNKTCKTQNFYILLVFVLITIALLIAGSIYCYLIKYQSKQKHYLQKFYSNTCIIKVSNKVNNIDIKKCTYYFFNDIIDKKTFDPNNVKIDEKSYKNVLIYYIGYVTIKECKNLRCKSFIPYFQQSGWIV